ncbi:Uncharacterised protein [uncultured archaeon]|nr:Uncharacterised protein [uncultured archaeon]
MKRGVAVIFFFLIFISFASAHQPRIVYQENLTANAKLIQAPEISQAFYAELKGTPEYYRIVSGENFNFFIQITLPYVETSNKNFTFEIFKGNELIAVLNGTNFNWTTFHEEFANDDYWQGPSLELNETAGEYLIKVSNPNTENNGKYVLVVGKIESFPLTEVFSAVYQIPQLKIYFNKNPLFAYLTLVSLFSFWPILIFLIFIILATKSIIKHLKKKYSRKSK